MKKPLTAKLTNQPVKGTSDWFPAEFLIRKHIFDTWRKVCKQFGFEEYLTPIVENASIYRAKSGENVGGDELMGVSDPGGRDIVIRPEMTPSVARMISRKYTEIPKPIKYFSIANFFRKERPQRGRNREFWQLNFDIFGSCSLTSDIEIIQIAIEIMLAFTPPKNSFIVQINDRRIIDSFLELIIKMQPSHKKEALRILDKWDKLSENDFTELLKNINFNSEQIRNVKCFMKIDNEDSLIGEFPALEKTAGIKEIKNVIGVLKKMGYGDWVKFKSSIIRGFDYYNGMVFEVFDRNMKENARSLFGGGRYDNLTNLYGLDNVAAVGCAPGDETMKLFLESWNLDDDIRERLREEIYYLPLLDNNLEVETLNLAKKIRTKNIKVLQGLEIQRLSKALEFANKKNIQFVVIFGKNEAESGKAIIKDMASGSQSFILI